MLASKLVIDKNQQEIVANPFHILIPSMSKQILACSNQLPNVKYFYWLRVTVKNIDKRLFLILYVQMAHTKNWLTLILQ